MQLELKFSPTCLCVCVCVFFIVSAEFCSNLLHISCSCAKFMMALISLFPRQLVQQSDNNKEREREEGEKVVRLLTDFEIKNNSIDFVISHISAF